MAGRFFKNNYSCSVLTSLIFFSASVTYAQEPVSPTLSHEGWAAWLVEAMARESEDLEHFTLDVPARNFSSSMIGQLETEPQDYDGDWHMTSNIGSDTSMECWIYSTPMDPASLTVDTADIGIQGIVEANGELGDEFIYYLDGGVIGNHSYLALEKLFMVGTAPDLFMASTKVRVANMDKFHIACSHNEIGFRETFARGFERLVLEATFDPSPIQPFFRQVIRLSMGGQVIGLIDSAYEIDADGDLAVKTTSASMVPVDGSTVSTEDSLIQAYWRPDGELININASSATNGELDMNLSLTLGENGGYSVAGMFQGKDLKVDIETDEILVSEVSQQLETQRMIADPEQNSITMSIWEPSADPTQFLEGSMAFEPGGRKDLKAIATIGPITMKFGMDKYGNLLRGLVELGPTTTVMENILMLGEPPTIDADKQR